MLSEFGAPLFASHGYTLHALYIKLAPQTFTQWGYLVQHPDETFAVFKDKTQGLQYLDQVLNGTNAAEPPVPAAEKILQEDMVTSPSTSALITTD